jgi:hypothetical protein
MLKTITATVSDPNLQKPGITVHLIMKPQYIAMRAGLNGK